MIAYYQKIVDCEIGDCWRTCIASILEIPQLEVPNFVELYRHSETGAHWKAVEWLKGRDIDINTASIKVAHKMREWSDYPFVIASGPSLSFPGVYHACIADLRGNIVHDPNPSGKGLAEIKYYEFFRNGFRDIDYHA